MNSMNLVNSGPYLAHYGIKGQKWGIRRFQDANGKLTAEGRRQARKEYKADNREAFYKGKEATLSARAADYAEKRYRRAEKYSRNQAKIQRRKTNAEFWRAQASKSEAEVKSHYDSLVKKYGKEAVSNVHRDKHGRVNEKVHRGRDKFNMIAGSALMYIGFSALGSPVAPVILPASRGQYARRLARAQEKAMKSGSRISF